MSQAFSISKLARLFKAGNNGLAVNIDGEGNPVLAGTLSIASAATTNLGAAASENVDITGTVTITSFGTVAAGVIKRGRFTGILTVTHNATSLIMPGGVNYITIANDSTYEARSLGAGNWMVLRIGGNRTAMGKLPSPTSTVASDALTIGAAPEYLTFRSATLASGEVSTILASPANIVVPSGATLGTVNAIESVLTVGVMNVAGVAELFVMNARSILPAGANENGLITTIVLNVDSDSQNVAYSTTARTAMPFRMLGQVTSTQATPGRWATTPSIIQGLGGLVMPKRLMQNLNVTTGEVATGTTAVPYDNTIPQITEGDQFMTLAITPTSTTSLLEITVVAIHSHTVATFVAVCLFRDAVADALAMSYWANASNYGNHNSFTHRMISGTTNEIIFRVRLGGNTGATSTFNGVENAAYYGGKMSSSITIKEYAA